MKYSICCALFVFVSGVANAVDVQSARTSIVNETPTWQIFKAGQGNPVRWKRHPENPRFMIFDGGSKGDQSDDVVWDRETGLTWERKPSGELRTFSEAKHYCFNKIVGGRRGARMPAIEELATLSDPTRTQPALPLGHPFNLENLVYTASFQSSTTSVEGNAPPELWYVLLQSSGEIGIQTKTSARHVMCVRGGKGLDGNSDQ